MDRSAKVLRQPQTLFKILLSQPQPAATYRGTVYAAVGLDSNISSFVASCLTIRRRRSAPLERTQHPNYSPILGFTSQAFVRSPTSYIPLSLFVLK